MTITITGGCMPEIMTRYAWATTLACLLLASCGGADPPPPPTPAECEGLEDEASCTSNNCVYYGSAVWYSLPDACDSGEERPACLAPERVDQGANNTFRVIKPQGTTEPEMAIRVSDEQSLQGWESCELGEGGACACPRL